MKAECPSKAQRSSLNTINTLPQTIIESILCLLPVEEAARTSILSREWRYKWTKIPKLMFDWHSLLKRKTESGQTSDMARTRETMDHRCKFFNTIHQVLLMRQGPIHDFALYLNLNFDCFELSQIISHLSTNHNVKKLCLEYAYGYKLPLSTFSLHHLTDLHLHYCNLDHKPTFNGFSSLTRLYLSNVKISTEVLLHLLSNCPSLKSLTLLISSKAIGCQGCTILELFECLPMIEHFTTWGYIIPRLTLDLIQKEFPTTLIHLKRFCFENVSLVDDRELVFLLVLIKCSPNLEKITVKIDVQPTYCYNDGRYFDILEEYSDVRLEHLIELEIIGVSNLKHELKFVKFILARSPKLKKVSVSLSHKVNKDKEIEMLKDLLRAPRASQVDIVVKCPHMHHM